MAFKGLDREDFAAPMAEINTTPLVDVMLVLMVIFLVTAPMLTQAMKVELPNETATEIADRDPITLSVTAGGEYYWGDEAISEAALEEKLQAAAAHDKEQPVHLRADKQATYERVSRILALAQKHGIANIGFVTQPK